MLMIRLQRIGRTNDPSFRIVVTEKTASPKAGTYVELVGNYDPRQKRVALKEDRIKYWLSQGAKASGTVHNLLVTAKVTQGPKIDVSPSVKKKPFDPATSGTQDKEGFSASAEATAGKEQPKKEEMKSEEKPPDAKAMEDKKEEKETPTAEEPKEETKKEG